MGRPVTVNAWLRLKDRSTKRLEQDRRECWYRRYTLKFDKVPFDRFGISTEGIEFDEIAQLDGVRYLRKLAEIGERVAAVLVKSEEL